MSQLMTLPSGFSLFLLQNGAKLSSPKQCVSHRLKKKATTIRRRFETSRGFLVLKTSRQAVRCQVNSTVFNLFDFAYVLSSLSNFSPFLASQEREKQERTSSSARTKKHFKGFLLSVYNIPKQKSREEKREREKGDRTVNIEQQNSHWYGSFPSFPLNQQTKNTHPLFENHPTKHTCTQAPER